jgi:hypothetical protein
MRLTLALVALVLALAGGVFFASAWRRDGAARVEAEIAGVRFAYAAAFARDDATAAGGDSERLGFVMRFPDFGPLRLPANPLDEAVRARAEAAAVFVTAAVEDGVMDPAERPAQLYGRFLRPEAAPGPGGLILRRFEAESPYEGEELYVAPPEGRAFFARCAKPDADTRGYCLWLFREGRLDFELRFEPALLPQWKQLVEGARGFVRRVKIGG